MSCFIIAFSQRQGSILLVSSMQQNHTTLTSAPVSDGKSAAVSAASGYKVFVGGLSINCKSKELRQYLEKFGEVTQCDVAGEKEGKSKGFAFATYRTKEARTAALGKNHQLKGKSFEVRELVDSTKNSEILLELSRRKLYLSNLKKSVTENELISFFSKYGTVEELTINRDVETQESKGFGFVMFADCSSVHAILGPNQSKVMKFAGSDLIVKQAIPKKEIERQKQGAFDEDQSFSDDQEMGGAGVPPGLNEQFYQFYGNLSPSQFSHPGFGEKHSFYPDQYYNSQPHRERFDMLYYPNAQSSVHSRGYQTYEPSIDDHLSPEHHIGSHGQRMCGGYPPQDHMFRNQHQPPQFFDPHYVDHQMMMSPEHSKQKVLSAGWSAQEVLNAPQSASRTTEQAWGGIPPAPWLDNIQQPQVHLLARIEKDCGTAAENGGRDKQQLRTNQVQSEPTNSLKSNSGKFDTDSVETSQFTEAVISPQYSGLRFVCAKGPNAESRLANTEENAQTQFWSICDECRRKIVPGRNDSNLEAQKSIFDFLRNKNCVCQESIGRSQFISQFRWTHANPSFTLEGISNPPTNENHETQSRMSAGLQSSQKLTGLNTQMVAPEVQH